MNKLRGLAFVVAYSGLVFLSGCSGFKIGGAEPTDRINSRYKDVYKKEADRTKLDSGNAFDLVDCYGSIGELEKMDRIVEKMTEMDIERGMDYGDHAEKYNKF